jgi:DNA-binding MarR family transcriptional regulator
LEFGVAHGHEIAMVLRAAYWAMHRRADALLARHGVTADQFVLLSILSEAGEATREIARTAENGVTQQELVRRASSDPNTVRAMLVLLERGGLVSRRPHLTDGRARSVVLTARGRRTLQRLWLECTPFHAYLIRREHRRTHVDQLARLSQRVRAAAFPLRCTVSIVRQPSLRLRRRRYRAL